MNRMVITILFFSFVLSVSTAHAAPSPLTWESAGDDLEILQYTFKTGMFSSSSMTAIRTSLSRYRLAVLRATELGLRRTTARALCKARHGIVCINANFFDEQGRPLGLVTSRGVIFQKLQRGGDTLTAVLAASRSSLQIVPRDQFSPIGITDAVQAGPRLLSKGHNVVGLKEPYFSANLSGACLDSKKRLVIYRVASGLFGCSLAQLQELLKHPEIQCEEALNFDGGGSSQLYISAAIPGSRQGHEEIDLVGDDQVPVVVAFLIRDL